MPSSPGPLYLVDGYNFLFRLIKNRTTFTAKRLQFIQRLNKLAVSLHLNVTIVFDSSDPHARIPSREHFDALEIIYTIRDLSADAFILEKIHASKCPEHITVVSSDRDLTSSCKALKAKTISVESFVASLNKKIKNRKKKPLANKAQLLRDSEAEIDRLLRIFEKRLDHLN